MEKWRELSFSKRSNIQICSDMASIITQEMWDYCLRFFALDVHDEEGLSSHFIHMRSVDVKNASLNVFSENIVSALAFIEKETGYIPGPHSYQYRSCAEATAIAIFYRPEALRALLRR